MAVCLHDQVHNLPRKLPGPRIGWGAGGFDVEGLC